MPYVKVKVSPGSKKESIVQLEGGSYAVSVREKAERNLANTRVRELIAREFNVPLKAVEIVTGHKGKSKILFIRDNTDM